MSHVNRTLLSRSKGQLAGAGAYCRGHQHSLLGPFNLQNFRAGPPVGHPTCAGLRSIIVDRSTNASKDASFCLAEIIVLRLNF